MNAASFIALIPVTRGGNRASTSLWAAPGHAVSAQPCSFQGCLNLTSPALRRRGLLGGGA